MATELVHRRTRKYTQTALLLWFLIASAAGLLDSLTVPGQPPVAVGLLVLLPILFFGALYLTSFRFRDFANSISLPLIVGIHVWRYVGLGFVGAVLVGQLPAGFGIPEGLGDAIAAVFALPLALAIYWKKPVREYFVAWNIFGLVDLLSAITVGVLYSEGALGFLRGDISTRLMTTFPISLIPTFLVPLFILLHLLALARRNEVAAARQLSRNHTKEVAA